MAKPSSNLVVAISTVADGTMLDKEHPYSDEILAHRRRWLTSVGVDPARASWVPLRYEGNDYCRYVVVDDERPGQGVLCGDASPADAYITTVSGRALFLPVADCIATVLYDPVHRVLMMSHLGRHSLEQDGARRSVQYLIDQYGTDPRALHIWTSPAVGKSSYRIYALNNKGMKEALFEQLESAGVRRRHIIDNPADTATDDRYFSHSAFLQGKKPNNGRFAMVAMMCP